MKSKNQFVVGDNYITGITSNTKKEFYFDKDIFTEVQNHTWRESAEGYIICNINGHDVLHLHRLAMNCPKDMYVDHINGDRHDNRKSQLRLATKQENNRNRGVLCNNTSGHTGVVFAKDRNKWLARIKVDNKYKVLGYFVDINDAIKAREDAEKEYFGEFAYKKTKCQSVS